jgi:hypothetical protein
MKTLTGIGKDCNIGETLAGFYFSCKYLIWNKKIFTSEEERRQVIPASIPTLFTPISFLPAPW